VELDISGLEDLGANAMYEGWVIVDGAPVSTGIFSVWGGGWLSQYEFPVSQDAYERATAFVLTVEPYPDGDLRPSNTHILGGDFMRKSASLSVGHPAALGNDFTSSSGRYILATPTNGSDTNERSGIWFLDLSSGGPAQGLMLPTLPAGWKYEGWAVIGHKPVTTGTFTDPNGADEAAPYSGPMGGPPFPGEDFLVNAPSGLVFPTNISGGTAVISIEPDPDNSPAPFTLKPLVGAIPNPSVDHFTYMMSQNLGSFPSGSAKLTAM
jgi:hypothetical protein